MKGGLLTHLLITKEMTKEEIYANVTEMLLAGVDTVCVCVCLSAYSETLKDGDVSEECRGAVSKDLAGGGIFLFESVLNLSFNGWVSAAISVPV